MKRIWSMRCSARAERVLKERDAQFQHAVEVANLGYYTWDQIDKTYSVCVGDVLEITRRQ